MAAEQGDVTRLLGELRRGEREAETRLIALVYKPLRQLAMNQMRRERLDSSLQATALVHEVYLRLVKPGTIAVQNRTHFMAVAAKVMRRILVDHARTTRAQKRGGTRRRVDLDESVMIEPGRSEDVLALDECLERLAKLDRRQSEIVQMKFFGGMTEEEIASIFDVSERTIRREWRMARAWLYSELTRSSSPGPTLARSDSKIARAPGIARRASAARGGSRR
jgi:RNA polymerase sigma factor (TIGR02999 family)